MRTAVIGGTFDPVHLGHLHLIHSLIEATDYQRILIIPVAHPPHKKHEHSVSDADRVEMLNIALQEYPTLYPHDREVEMVVDTCEIDRGGISYMYDTVNELYHRYQVEGEIGMVLGDDLLSGLRRWYRFEELRHKVEFIVIRRTEQPLQQFPPGVRGRLLDNPVMEDSSTQVRELIRTGEATVNNLAPLVSPKVIDYLLTYGLYRS